MDGSMRLPLARSEGLVVEELGEELLVYDTDVKNVHCLSGTAARVWRTCDGAASKGEIAAQLGLTAEEVQRALNELDDCKLLDGLPIVSGGFSRRELGVKTAKVAVGAASVPLIMSIAAPAAAQAQTIICANIASAQNCGDCNIGGTGQNPCCCCHNATSVPAGAKFRCAEDAEECATFGGSHCTEN